MQRADKVRDSTSLTNAVRELLHKGRAGAVKREESAFGSGESGSL